MPEKSVKSRSRKKEQQPVSQAELPLRSQLESEENTDSHRYLFLTNRNNLLDILSSGWIRPATKYKKYYDDPGSLCPQAIPLLIADPSPDFIQALLPSDPDIFPVLLDLDLQGMSGEIQIILNTYQVEQGVLPLQTKAIGIVVRGIIPVSCIRCIYFKSAAEREEHKSTRYKNVRTGSYPLYVAPDRFQGASLDIELLRQALHQAQQQAMRLDVNLFPGVEALGGALVLLGSLATRDPRFPLQALHALLMTVWHYNSGQDAAQEISNMQPNLVQYLDSLPRLLLNDAEHGQIIEAETGFFSADIAQYINQSNSPADLLLFCLTVKILAYTGIEDYLNEEILYRVKNAWEHLQPEILSEETQGIYLELLDSIHAVLRSRINLTDFPATQSLAATSLLFFLLRSRPEQTLSWIEERPSSPSDVLALAVTLAGVLSGKSLIPVSDQANEAFEKYIDEILAWKLNTVHYGLLTSILPAQTTIEISGDREILKSAEQILIQSTIQGDWMNPFEESYSSSQITGAPEQALSEQRPPIQSEDPLLLRLLEEDLSEKHVRDAALYLCEILNWEECITTVISLEKRRFVLNHRPELRIGGFLRDPFEIIIHVDRFRRRLTNEAWYNLPDAMKEQVKALLENTL